MLSCKYKTVIAAVTLLLNLTLGASAETVSEVLDGDTIVLQDGRHIRLAGIDAPEKDQPYGMEAREYLKHLVLGQDITLQCEGKQSYHRDVCVVSLNGKSIQQEMVVNGYAFDSTGYSTGRYLDLETYARRNRLGMWKDMDLTFPWTHRHSNRLDLFHRHES